LPQGALEIKAKVTYHLAELLTLKDAWKQVISFLDLVGYTIEPEGDMQIIRKIDTNINRQILTVYINEPLDNIPDNENFIRAVFYLANINVKTSWTDISNILKDMLSPTADIRSDVKTNAIILSDKATNIKAAMRIIFELDKGGLRDSIEVIPLYYTSATLVETLFTKDLFAQKPPTPGAGAQPQPEQISYFPKNTKIIGLPRNNTLVIMGTPYAIDLVKDFIIKYIDRPLESGKSILHLYDLQYLDAQTFAPILQQFVTPAQAAQAAGQVITGPKQYFKDVIVVAEKTSPTEQIKPSTVATAGTQAQAEAATVGGNRLIIAARQKDWMRIKQLIGDLDKPQPQVAIEVLVADVTLNSDKFLGSQMRNKQGFNDSISQGVDWQTAQLRQPVLKETVNIPGTEGFIRPANALMSNLLQLDEPFLDNNNLATIMDPGSLVFSLKDSANNGIWSVWQLINNYANATLIAQPFVITKNHQQASVTISQQRFIPGKVDTSNTAASVANEWVTAAFTIDILPHISETNNINLQIVVKINQFIATDVQNNTRLTRLVQTNANVGNGQILALGGLTRESVVEDIRQTPLFSKIPILGWFFKQKRKVKQRNNLIIFISPTIIQPRPKGGTDPFTDRKLSYAQDNLDESVCFENLRDPITRWFFKPDPFYAEDTINDYKKRTLQDQYGSTNQSNNSPRILEQSGNKKYAQTVCTTNANNIKELVKDEENPLLATNQESSKQASNKAKQMQTKTGILDRVEQPKKNTNPVVVKKSTVDAGQLKNLMKDEDNPLLANPQAKTMQVHPQS